MITTSGRSAGRSPDRHVVGWHVGDDVDSLGAQQRVACGAEDFVAVQSKTRTAGRPPAALGSGGTVQRTYCAGTGGPSAGVQVWMQSYPNALSSF
jgi:hypothetical protein